MTKIYLTRSASIYPKLSIKTTNTGKSLPVFSVENKFVDTQYDRVTLLAKVCAEKIKQSISIEDNVFTQSLICVAGSARGATQTLENSILDFNNSGTTSALTSPLTTSGAIASSVANMWDMPAIAIGTSMACASFFEAILIAESVIKSKRFNRALVLGAEAALTDFTIAQMQALKLYSSQISDNPCQPFAKNPLSKNSMVLGEGAACFLLENDQSLIETGNTPILELSSLGYIQERNISLTGMDSEGQSFVHSMMQALTQESCNNFPDAIFAHAPGTQVGDTAEYQAILQVAQKFNKSSASVFCTKSIFGHTFGASSALSLAFAIDSINSKAILKHSYPIKDNISDVDFSSTSKNKSFLINSAGFGGVIGSMLFKTV
jgi:3-oxoacyl-[acyl-carrier-protein] synthase II